MAVAAARAVLIDLGPLRSSAAFRRIWLGSSLSALGGQAATVALLVQVWQLTGSTLWTGALGLAQAIPIVLGGLFAGSATDRVDRRRAYLVMTAGQSGCALLLAALALALHAASADRLAGQGAGPDGTVRDVLAGQLPVLGVLLLAALQAGFGTSSGPAARTFVPRLLPPEQLAAGQALQRVGFQTAMMVGPALGGLAVHWFGLASCYLLDAISFLAALHAVRGLPAMPPDGEPARPGLGGIRDGLAFLLGHPAVRAALLTDLAVTVLSMPISLLPRLNAERFGGDPRSLGLLLTAVAVGGVTASAASGTFTRIPAARLGGVMLTGASIWATALVLLALVPGRWLGLALLALAGAGDTVSVVCRSTIVQTHTPDALLGRVSAAEQIVGQAGPDLGSLRAGIVAAATSTRFSLATGGLLCLVAVALIGATTRDLSARSASRSGQSADPVDGRADR